MKKISSLFLIFILIFQSLAVPVHSMSTIEETNLEQAFISTDQENGVPLLKDHKDSSNLLMTLHNGDQVVILEEFGDFSYVEFEASETIQGFIENKYLSKSDDQSNVEEAQKETSESTNELTEIDEVEESIVIDEENEANPEVEEDTKADTEKNETSETETDTEEVEHESEIEKNTADKDANLEKVEKTEEEVEIESKEETDNVQQIQARVNQQSLTVIGRRNPTNVRAEPSTKTNVIATFEQGEKIDLKTFNEYWYQITVQVNGKKQTGYIHKKHVDEITKDGEAFKGIGIKSPTNVRARASTKSKVNKALPIGSIIDLKTFSTHWYKVIDDGKTIGYIHKKHIGDTVNEKQDSFKGIGIKKPTNVRKLPSTKAGVEKALPIGSIINLKTFSEHWYEATLSNGKIGYVHKYHIGDTVNKKQNGFKGIGIKKPTNVRKLPSTKAGVEKALPIGSIINLKTFSEHWYEATLSNGKTGYVHKKHIGDTVNEKKDSFKGIGIKNPTIVRKLPSTQANRVTSLPAGTIVKANTLSKHWNKVKLSNNQTGYIHSKHLNKVYDKRESFYGAALKPTTNIRHLPSTHAKVIHKIKKGSIINLKTFSRYWHQAIVKVDNKTLVGYVHRKHVDENPSSMNINYTDYPIDFNKALNIQMSQNPQISGPSGKFIKASQSQVSYYLNPSNFDVSSNSFFQFLVLSQPANLNISEVNKKILKNNGVLEGQAEAFIKAAKKFDINEAYLISHAKLETGNGKSTLATGVPVDKNGNVTKNSKGDIAKTSKTKTIVYNMYGIGAVDSNPLEGGAKRAFKEGWDSVEKAIIGGAQFINSYIGRGQDTLYKMRWNPDSPGYPQYSTDVGWAVKPTSSIAQIYQLLDDYILVFDVPKYKNQPSSSGNPNKYVYTHLEIIANTGVNIRSGAGTSHSIIDRVVKEII